MAGRKKEGMHDIIQYAIVYMEMIVYVIETPSTIVDCTC